MRILSEPKSTLRLLLHTLTLGVVLLAASQSISESFSAQENAGTSLAPDAQVLALIPKALPGAEPFPDELRNRLANNLAARPADYEPRSKNLRADGTALYTNRLLLETSPYLQQHAHNPVNFYPWGEEAFAAAKRLDRPILISIGYSTCHWCHVMEEETFDDPIVVRYLNEHFISIKVDRERRPDVDSIYMSALHSMGQRGGWPLNVWITPNGEPFFGGTYFPPQNRGGQNSFATTLKILHTQYSDSRNDLVETGKKIAQKLRANLEANAATSSQIPGKRALSTAVRNYSRSVDRTWGGLGRRTKFPSSLPIRFLLRYHRRTGDQDALTMATLTLDKMANGGIHDQIGGGFHRYTTEPRWLVPHFEKMLYDNALLAMAYLEAGQLTGRKSFEVIARSTLDYVAREMTAASGGFYSATDADNLGPHGEMEEGQFFTWTPSEVRALLPAPVAAAAIAYWGISEVGNFEGRTILHAWRQEEAVANQLGVDVATLRSRLTVARAKLYQARALRHPPLRDEKILVAWNGLMISAFAQAGFTLNEAKYTAQAAAAARYVLDEMRIDGRLRRISLDGAVAGPAFLEDYAFLIAALLDLYEADHDPGWLSEAYALQATLDRHYADEGGGGYFRSADDGERLLAREKPGRDGAVPSGNSIAAMNLLRLAEFSADPLYLDRATMLFSAFYETVERAPTALSELLLALEFRSQPIKEIVIVAPRRKSDDRDGLDAMLKPLRSTFLPSRVLSIVHEGVDQDAHEKVVPLVGSKPTRQGRTTAYVCENRVCAFPTDDPEVFARQLRKSDKERRR